MLRNMLLVTYRNLIKNKSYTFINVIGLALGIAAFVIIRSYVYFERSYDHMNHDADNIYRVESQFYKGNTLKDDWATSTNGYATAMKANFPEIASFTRINWNNAERVMRYNNVKFREEHVCFADSNFFRFFDYKVLKGDALSMLTNVNTIVISESAAKRYFGSADPIGKFMDVTNLNSSLHCMVTGVFADVPPNTTMKFNFLISWNTTPLFFRDFWYIHESYTFVKLKPNTNIPALEAKFPALAERYKTALSMKDQKWAIKLVPLTSIHLNPAKPNEIESKGNAVAVNFLNIMAFVILVIACVNYVNLATTKAADRAREVGIRKVSGARVGQVLTQFLVESAIINAMALVVGLVFIRFAIYYLPAFTGKTASASLLFGAPLYIETAVAVVAGMLLSGFYPALVLARVNPVTVLKGRFTFSKSGVVLRRGMVAFQFTASLLLIAGTIAIYRQLHYMSTMDTGISMEQTIVMKAPVVTPNYDARIRSFVQSVKNIPGVKIVTASGGVPGKEVGEFSADRRYGASKSEERLYETLRVDFNFIKAYDLQVVEGRAFDESRVSDSTGVILNEAAVKQFGFASAKDAVGKKVWMETLDNVPNQVIGVIKNYHQQSAQVNYTPLILLMDPKLDWVPTRYYSVKMESKNPASIVAGVRSVWAENFPESSFDLFFLDDFYNNQYQQVTTFGNTFTLFAALAIVIACMGLFGLTAYNTSRRTKEIGIRKVLGASVQNIMTILTWDVIRLILTCSLVAIPVAYLLVNAWLNDYAFKAALSVWQFAAPVVVLVLITLSTISYLTFNAARSNPAKTLNDE